MIDEPDHIPELARLKEISERLVSPELAVRIVEDLPDALVVVSNDDGRIVLFNGRAELIFGYSRVEILGQKIEVLVPDARRESHVKHRETFADDPRARPMGSAMLLAARRKDGSEFQVKINLSPIPTTDGIFTCAIVRRTDV